MLGDSTQNLLKLFGKPTKISLNVVDDAIENTEPSQNIYYFGKNYFSEPYLISEGLIGGFKILDNNFCFEINIEKNAFEYNFKIGEKFNIDKLLKAFPHSFLYTKKHFVNRNTRSATLYLEVIGQNELFPYPYPLIEKLVLYYRDGKLFAVYTDYYAE